MEIRKASKYEYERTEEIVTEILKIFHKRLSYDEINDFNLPVNIMIKFLVSFFSSVCDDLEIQKKFSCEIAAGMIKIFEEIQENGN